MGTSKGYDGTKKGLVPSWADDAASEKPPALGGSAPAQPPGGGNPQPQRADTSTAGDFGPARSNFTRFARGGGREALGRALSGYVRQGTGGARNAMRRMGAARSTGGRLLGFIRDVQRVGAAAALRTHNLSGLAGRPATEVFVALVDVICSPGGPINEAIARQAMLDAINDLAEAGIGAFDTMTPDQLKEFFVDFVARSIEERVMADIAQRSIALPDDVDAVQYAQQQLHDFVSGCTRNQLSDRLGQLDQISDQDIQQVVDDIFEAAFDLVLAAAEAAT